MAGGPGPGRALSVATVLGLLLVPLPVPIAGGHPAMSASPAVGPGDLAGTLVSIPHRTAGGSGPRLPPIRVGVDGTLPAALGAWSTYEYGPDRSGYNAEESTITAQDAGQLRVVWNVSFPGPLFASPSVVNGTVYEGSWDGNETALYASNGTVIWNSFLGIENFTGQSYGCPWANPIGVTSAATVVNGTVYVGSATRYYALNATDGAPLWSYNEGSASAGYYAWSSPLYYRGEVYVGISSQCDNPLVTGGLLALNASTGKLVHQLSTGSGGSSIWSSPTVDAPRNTIWVTTGNGYYDPASGNYGQAIVEVNATTLGVQGSWQAPAGPNDIDFGADASLFATANGSLGVVATNKDGYAYAVNRSDPGAGAVWADQLTTFPGSSGCQPPGQSIEPGTVANGSLFLASSYTTINHHPVNGSVREIDPSNGTYLWQTPTNGSVLGGLASAPGLVVDVSRDLPYTAGSGGCKSYSGTNNSWLQVLNASSGAPLYSYYAPYVFSVAPSIADGRIFVSAGTADESEWTAVPRHEGHLYAFGLPLNATVGVRVNVPDPNTSASSDLLHANVTGGMPGYSCAWTDADGPVASGCTAYISPPPHEVNLTLTVRDAANETWNQTFPVNGTLSFWAVSLRAVPATIWLGNTTDLEVNASGNGADPPYTYRYANLPNGCAAQNESPLPCAPSGTGAFQPSVLVTQANGDSLSARTNLTVIPPSGPPPPQLTGFAVHPSRVAVGEPLEFSGLVTGGAPPLTEALLELPPGCTTGGSVNLTCIPTSPGTFTVEARVVDLSGRAAAANASVEVLPAFSITGFSASPVPVPLGSVVSFSVGFTGGAPNYSVEYLGLPTGCPPTNRTAFDCTPTASGTYNVTVQVTPGVGAPATAWVVVTVASSSPGTVSGYHAPLAAWTWELPIAVVGTALLAILAGLWARRRR